LSIGHLGYALDASARNGARLWSKTQPQRLADAQDVGTTPRAAAGAPHTAALRSANLRQVHSPIWNWVSKNGYWLSVQTIAWVALIRRRQRRARREQI